MVIDDKYKIGQLVYLTTDEDQLKRIVTGIIIRSGNLEEYELTCGMDISRHVEIEITKSKTYV
ncbi:hypothetical protein [uncultured Winogradskyella sp.]|uniref:hypothetical protein n=1 Tax=uncultured Winogradskyella sp. TaxID=395353 RepID=UPI002605351D|nr:hypothetical protein [uncultured Winogradskyella sp.]